MYDSFQNVSMALEKKSGIKKGTNQTIVLDMTHRWTSSSGFLLSFLGFFEHKVVFVPVTIKSQQTCMACINEIEI